MKESFIFIGSSSFRLEDYTPDHTTLSRFRNEIVAKKTYKILLKKLNQ
ncbi:MAG: transposase [Flavobacteriales bacterium Tduv]